MFTLASLIDLAMIIKEELLRKGYKLYMDSDTNQQFFIIPKEIYTEISDRVILDNWGEYDTDSYICRITTSWATTEESVKYLLQIL